MARILIVGAGVAGLLAAHALTAAGHRPVVLDKGHQPGGRLATRTVDGAVFDHGAQFLTVRDPRVADHVRAWRDAGVAAPFFRGSPDLDAGGPTPVPSPGPQHAPDAGRDLDADGHLRYRGTPTMRRIAEHLAVGLDLHLGVVAERVTADTAGAQVSATGRDGAPEARTFTGDALLLTAPLPQTLALLDAGDVRLQTENRAQLAAIDYEPCIAVLAIPHDRPALPAAGVARLDGPVVWLTDNQATGASPVPAVTVHAGGTWSRSHVDTPDAEVARDLLDLAREQLGTEATAVAVHRWRYARPTSRAAEDAILDTACGVPIAFAGDGLTGGRVEGAAVSGLAAADRLIAALD